LSFGLIVGFFKTRRLNWNHTPPEPEISDDAHDMECDEMRHFCGVKRNNISFWKALDRGKNRPVAWVIGLSTCKQRDDNVKHLKNCIFFTDHWDAFSNVLPKDCRVIRKKHTVFIERDNSNTRNGLGHMTRRTTIISKKEERGHSSIKLWAALETPEIFAHDQKIFSFMLR
jgi:insertion element IS1 protein InsB